MGEKYLCSRRQFGDLRQSPCSMRSTPISGRRGVLNEPTFEVPNICWALLCNSVERSWRGGRHANVTMNRDYKVSTLAALGHFSHMPAFLSDVFDSAVSHQPVVCFPSHKVCWYASPPGSL